jgi:hypothetical protein
VERYFYLMIPYERKRTFLDSKTNKTKEKSEYITKISEREDFIKKFGQKKFDELSLIDDNLSKLRDIPMPQGFVWLFSHFLEIWRNCETNLNGYKIFTPRQILDYSDCFCVYFSVREKQLLLKWKEWADITIADLNKSKN